MNKVELDLKKIMYAGVYAGLKSGSVFVLSDKIKPIEDASIEHKLNRTS